MSVCTRVILSLFCDPHALCLARCWLAGCGRDHYTYGSSAVGAWRPSGVCAWASLGKGYRHRDGRADHCEAGIDNAL